MDFLGLFWAASLLKSNLPPSLAFVEWNRQPVPAPIVAAPVGGKSTSVVEAFTPLRMLSPHFSSTEVRDTRLASGLPTLPENAVDWATWNAVADVSVVSVPLQHPPIASAFMAGKPHQCLHPPPLPGAEVAHTQGISSLVWAGSRAAPQERFQIWVHEVPIGEVTTATTAYQIAAKLRRLTRSPNWQSTDFQPFIGPSFAAGRADEEILFVVDPSMLPDGERPSVLVAAEWISNLRVAAGRAPLELADVQMALQGLTETRQQLRGVASWYGPYFHGRQTATGEVFDQHELTAAHPTLPFGTHLKVQNLLNGHTTVVRVNDRGPYIQGRSLDLSYAAAQCLGSEKVGVIPYTATVLRSREPISPVPPLLVSLRSD